MPTVGKTAIGGTTGDSALSTKRVLKVTVPERASISKLTMYCDGLGVGLISQVMKGIIYAQQPPVALLGTSAEVTVLTAAVAAWVDLVFTPAVTVEAGAHVIGFHPGSSTNVIRHFYDTLSASGYSQSADTYSDGASNPFGTATGGSRELSIYATYTAAPRTTAELSRRRRHFVIAENSRRPRSR